MRVGVPSLALAALMSTAASAEISVASWNMNNLYHQQRRTPSDHCPIVVVLDWPAAD